MNHPEIDFMLMQARRQDELAAAEHSRLVKMALAAQADNLGAKKIALPALVFQALLHAVGQVLYQVGLRIEGWGCQLQVRYAAGGRGAPCD